MIIRKYNCDKKQGEFEIKFSKQEVMTEDVVALCDYRQMNEGIYEINIFLGLSTYEEVKSYSIINLTCNYTNLKEKLVSWWKKELEKGAAMKIVDFINYVVKPNYIKEVAEVVRIYRVEMSDKKIFEVEIYPDKTLYYDISLFRTCVAAYQEKHNQSDMVRSIAELKNDE